MSSFVKIVLGCALGAVFVLQACTSNESAAGTSVVEEQSGTVNSSGRDAATSAISRAEVFEAQSYAPEELQQAYDLLSQGDASQSEDLWTQSKGKADEATDISAPLAGKKWLDQLKEDEQKLKDLRGDLYVPDYYSKLVALVAQAQDAADSQDWDLLLSVYQKTAQPLSQVVAALDSNLRWLNQLKQETEGILGEADRKGAKNYVLPVLAMAQDHYNEALDSLDANDLSGVEQHLFISRHYARETLRLLDIALNLKDVDGQIDRQGSRISRTLESLKQEGALEGQEQLQNWSSQGYLMENPLVEISMDPREYVSETSQLQKPEVAASELVFSLIPIRVAYQNQPYVITQEFDAQQPMGAEEQQPMGAEEQQPMGAEEQQPMGAEQNAQDQSAGIELLDKSRSSWEQAVTARNGGDLEKARYYLEESSRYLNSYTSQYSVLALYTVKKGDCLWRIAAQNDVYSDPYKWPYIYLRNRDLISNPNLIYPGQKFIIPVIDYDIPNIKQIIQDASDLYENSKKKR